MVLPLAEKDNMHMDSSCKQNKSKYLFRDKLSPWPARNWFLRDGNQRALSINFPTATNGQVQVSLIPGEKKGRYDSTIAIGTEKYTDAQFYIG
jgi:hypothetical protein